MTKSTFIETVEAIEKSAVYEVAIWKYLCQNPICDPITAKEGHNHVVAVIVSRN